MTRLPISDPRTVEKRYAFQHFVSMLPGIRDTMVETRQTIAAAIEKLQEK